MKKVLLLAALAFVLASCGSKDNSVGIDKFYENPVENLGKEIVLCGHAKACCQGLVITNCDGTKMIRVVPAEGVTVPENAENATLKVKGTVSEEVIDETYVIGLEDQANAEQDSTARADKMAKAGKVREMIAVEGIVRKYTIAATAIEVTKACGNKECKGGKAEANHEGCAKKCEGHDAEANHEGCEKKCEGQKAEGEQTAAQK